MDQNTERKLRDLQDAVDKDVSYFRALSLLTMDDFREKPFDIILLDIQGRLEKIARQVKAIRSEVR